MSAKTVILIIAAAAVGAAIWIIIRTAGPADTRLPGEAGGATTAPASHAELSGQLRAERNELARRIAQLSAGPTSAPADSLAPAQQTIAQLQRQSDEAGSELARQQTIRSRVALELAALPAGAPDKLTASQLDQYVESDPAAADIAADAESTVDIELQTQLAGLRARLGKDNPKVQALAANLAEQRRIALAARDVMLREHVGQLRSAAEKVRRQADARIAELQQRRTQIDSELQLARSRLERGADAQRELNELNDRLTRIDEQLGKP